MECVTIEINIDRNISGLQKRSRIRGRKIFRELNNKMRPHGLTVCLVYSSKNSKQVLLASHFMLHYQDEFKINIERTSVDMQSLFLLYKLRIKLNGNGWREKSLAGNGKILLQSQLRINVQYAALNIQHLYTLRIYTYMYIVVNRIVVSDFFVAQKTFEVEQLLVNFGIRFYTFKNPFNETNKSGKSCSCSFNTGGKYIFVLRFIFHCPDT